MGNTASFFLVPRKLLIDMWFILMNARHQSKNAGSAGSISEMFKITSTRIPFFVDKGFNCSNCSGSQSNPLAF